MSSAVASRKRHHLSRVATRWAPRDLLQLRQAVPACTFSAQGRSVDITAGAPCHDPLTPAVKPSRAFRRDRDPHPCANMVASRRPERLPPTRSSNPPSLALRCVRSVRYLGLAALVRCQTRVRKLPPTRPSPRAGYSPEAERHVLLVDFCSPLDLRAQARVLQTMPRVRTHKTCAHLRERPGSASLGALETLLESIHMTPHATWGYPNLVKMTRTPAVASRRP